MTSACLLPVSRASTFVSDGVRRQATLVTTRSYDHMIRVLTFIVFGYALSVSADGLGQANGVEYSIGYGGDGFEELFDVQPLSDGGFVAVGQTGSGKSGSLTQDPPTPFGFFTDLLAVRFDAQGQQVWEVRLGGAEFDQAHSVTLDPEGNILIAGNSDSPVSPGKSDPPLGGMDIWLVKLAPDGSRVFDKTFGTPNSEFTSGVEVMASGNILISGSSKTSATTEFDTATSRELDFYTLEVSPDGDLVRDQTFGGDVYDRSWGMIKLRDNGFMIYGGSASSSSATKGLGRFGKSDAWVVHLDASGSFVRDYQFGGPSTEQARALVEYANGDLLMLAETANNSGPPVAQEPPNRDPTTAGPVGTSMDNRDVYQVRFTRGPGPGTDIKWQNTRGGDGNDDARFGTLGGEDCMTLVGTTSSQTRNGGFTNGPIAGGSDAWIYQIDGSGNVIWDETHGGGQGAGDKLEYIAKSADGGFLMGGLSGAEPFDWKSDDNFGQNDLWFVKLGCKRVKLIDDELICATQTYNLADLNDPNPTVCTSLRWLDADGTLLSEDPTYQITVPDLVRTTVSLEGRFADGCRSADTVTITNTASLDFDGEPVVEPEPCRGSFGAVTVELTDAGGEFELENIRYPSGTRVELAPGSYTVATVEDAACVNTRSFTIDASTNDVVAPDFDIDIGQPSKCAGEPVLLKVAPGFTAPPSAEYLWTQNNGKEVLGADPELSIAPSKATTVTLRVTDPANNCAGKDSVAIPIDPAPVVVDYSINDASCSGSGSGITLYVELFPNDTPFEINGQAFTSSPQRFPVQPGSYRLTTVAASGECGLDITLESTKNAPFFVSLGPDLELCEGDQAEFSTVSTGLPNDAELSIVDEQGVIVGEDGAYSEPAVDSKTFVLTAETPNGCRVRDTLQLTVSSQPEAPEVDVVAASCGNTLDGALQVTSFDGLAYAFGGVEYTDPQAFTDLIAGTYVITSIADVSACNRSDSFDIVGENDFNLTLGDDVSAPTGSELTLTATADVPIDSFRWSGDVFADSLRFEGPSAMFQVLRSGEVVVTAYSGDGCSRSTSVAIEAADDRRVAIPTAFSPNGDGSNETFTIYTTPFVAEAGPMRIYDRWGNILFVGTDQNITDTRGWDGRRQDDGYLVSTGVYIYTVDIKFIDGTSRTFQGEVTLLR